MRSLVLVAFVTVVSLAAVASVGCSKSNTPSGPPSVSIPVGSLSLTVTPSTANVSVLAPDGGLLLEGIDTSTAVGTPQSDNDDAPPMTGFAVRDLSSTYTMSYGSFEVVDDTTQPWQVVTRASVSGNDDRSLHGQRNTRRVARRVRGDDRASLVVTITPGEGAPDASVPPPVPFSPDASDEDASTPTPQPTPAHRRISWGFQCTPDDHFAGFGAQTWGVDARG